jgi:hypothetical protein
MPKQLDLPPEVARAFVKDMRAFFVEENRYKQDEIALRQLHALKEHQGRAGEGTAAFRREGVRLAIAIARSSPFINCSSVPR